MSTLELIYLNPEFGTMLDFNIEISSSVETIYGENSINAAIPLLLRAAREIILEFGKSVEFPSSLSNRVEEVELDYILLLIEKSVDAFVDGHIYVRTPKEFSYTFKLNNETKENKIWQTNGAGLNGLILVHIGDQGIDALLATYDEIKNDFTTFRMPLVSK